MTAATLADWTTPQPFALPDLGPGIDGERRRRPPGRLPLACDQ